MSVVKFGELSGKSLDLGKITETKSKRRWLAGTNNNNDTITMVADYGYSNNLIPLPYVHFHPEFPLQLCRNVRIEQDSDAPRKWEIEATYSSEPLTQTEQEQEQTANPVDRPPKIKWKAQNYRKAIDRDLSGNAIVNSAGDYFDPPVEIDAAYWIATIEKNVLAVPTFILSYTNAINEAAFTIQGIPVAERVAKIVELDISDLQTEGDFQFFTFGYSLEFHPETWNLKVLDQGFRYLDAGDVKNITDDSSPPKPVSSPRMLNGSGGILSNPSPSTAIFIEFDDVYPASDFSVLPGIFEIA